MFTNGYMFLLSFYTLKIAAALKIKNMQPHIRGKIFVNAFGFTFRKGSCKNTIYNWKFWTFSITIMLWNKDFADIRGHMISINDQTFYIRLFQALLDTLYILFHVKVFHSLVQWHAAYFFLHDTSNSIIWS